MHLQVGGSQAVEDLSQPTQVSVEVTAEYYYVIQVDKAGHADESTKHQVH